MKKIIKNILKLIFLIFNIFINSSYTMENSNLTTAGYNNHMMDSLLTQKGCNKKSSILLSEQQNINDDLNKENLILKSFNKKLLVEIKNKK